jgi:hypothetical protein
MARRKVVLLAGDPGTANFGFAVVSAILPATGPPKNIEVLQFGRLHNTVRVLKQDLRTQVSAYSGSLRTLSDKYAVNAFIAERYQSRRMGGVTIECVNLMLGVSCEVFKDRPYKVVPASQWKNAAARAELWFDELYTELKPLKITPHAIDAVCIALFGLSALSKTPPYSFIKYPQLKKLLMKSKHEDLGDVLPRIRKVRKRVPRKKVHA